jgi:TusA-related sulfurtransferase
MGIPTSQATYEVLLEWALDTARLIAKEKYRLDDMTIKHMSPGDLLRVITDDYVPPIATVKVVRETTVIPQIPTERGQYNEIQTDTSDDFDIDSI